LVEELIIGTLTISILHALIPSHWIPILAFEKKFGWSRQQTLRVTIISALAHALSTVLLGIAIGLLSLKISKEYDHISTIISSLVLVVLGFVFIIRHHHHHHFHLQNEGELLQMSRTRIVAILATGMFLSPCLEIEGYFVLAGSAGLKYIFLVSAIYILISVVGIVIWLAFAKELLKKINTHKIEHNAGLISGVVLILTGILNYFVH
jgi:nickel/cobalt transporter (NicO) family protein